MKAVIYARQSSGSDDISESVEAQITNCRKLAAKENLEVIGIFKDLNSSGETYPSGAENIAAIDSAYQEWLSSQSTKKNYRTGLGSLLNSLECTNVILVNEHTRLYRPINGSFLEGHINYLLKKNHVKLLQVQGGTIDLAKFDQQLITSIKNQILYDDLQKKRQNSINALRKKRDSGKVCCGTKAFGLHYLGNDKIEVRREHIEIIRFIYDSICSYKTYSSIIKECNSRFKQYAFFYSSSIYNIARQPLYAGMQYNTAGELIKNIQMQGQEIIPFSQWSQVQKIISTRRHRYPGKAKKHWLPLSGKLFCGSCGRHLVCSIDKGKIYYVCNSCYIDSSCTGCRGSRIRFETGAYGEPALYDIVLPLLTIALQERQRQHDLIRRDIQNLSAYTEELENLENSEHKIYNLYLDGAVTEKQFRDMIKLYQKKHSNLTGNILRLQQEKEEQPIKEQEEKKIPLIFTKLRQGKLPGHIYQALLEESGIKITVFREKITVGTLHGEFSLPRLWKNNRCRLPEWKLAFYGSGISCGKTVITYMTGTKKLLADWAGITIKSK